MPIAVIALAVKRIVRKTEPVHCFNDIVFEFLLAAFLVRILDSQDKFSPRLPSEEIIENSRTDIARLKSAGWRRRKSCNNLRIHVLYLWSMGLGVWSMEYGIRSMEYGVWD